MQLPPFDPHVFFSKHDSYLLTSEFKRVIFFCVCALVKWMGIDSLITVWLFGTFFISPYILGMSSSQVTFIFFRGVGQPPTRLNLIF